MVKTVTILYFYTMEEQSVPKQEAPLEVEIIVIVGTANVLRYKEILDLVKKLNFGIILDNSNTDRKFCIALIEKGNEKMISKAITEAKPLNRPDLRKLIKELRDSLKELENTNNVPIQE